jgi:hypothetical protein
MRCSSFRQSPVDAAESCQLRGDARPPGRAFSLLLATWRSITRDARSKHLVIRR